MSTVNAAGTALLLLLGTLVLALVGIAQITRASDRRRDLAYAVQSERESSLKRLRQTIERRVGRTRVGRWLRDGLDRSDVGLDVADAVLVIGGLALAVSLVGWRLGGPILTLLMLIGFVLAVRAWFSWREQRRFNRFLDQLPELSRLLGNAASAGLSLRAGLRMAGQEMEEPTRKELVRINEELDLGAPVDDVLARWGERMHAKELRVLINVLVIQARAGGKIVTALRGITDALEVRRDLRREVNTLLAGSKATLVALCVLGVVIVFLVHTGTVGGLRALLENPIGFLIFAVSVSLFVFGVSLARKTLRIEV